MSLTNDVKTIPGLFGDAVEQLAKLVQNEVSLARAEISEKLTEAGTGIAYVGAGAILSIPVVVMLLITLALWLTQMGLSPVVAHLLATVVGAIGAGVLAIIGLKHLKPENLKPTVTMREVERDVIAVKEMSK